MINAGIEGRQLANENGDVPDTGILLYITVIVDGGWRSYGIATRITQV